MTIKFGTRFLHKNFSFRFFLFEPIVSRFSIKVEEYMRYTCVSETIPRNLGVLHDHVKNLSIDSNGGNPTVTAEKRLLELKS